MCLLEQVELSLELAAREGGASRHLRLRNAFPAKATAGHHFWGDRTMAALLLLLLTAAGECARAL